MLADTLTPDTLVTWGGAALVMALVGLVARWVWKAASELNKRDRVEEGLLERVEALSSTADAVVARQNEHSNRWRKAEREREIAEAIEQARQEALEQGRREGLEQAAQSATWPRPGN